MPELLMPFDTDDPQFVRGFEAGQLWERLSQRPDEHSVTLHSTNMQMAIRTASAKGYAVEFQQEDNTWIEARFVYQPVSNVIDGGTA